MFLLLSCGLCTRRLHTINMYVRSIRTYCRTSRSLRATTYCTGISASQKSLDKKKGRFSFIIGLDGLSSQSYGGQNGQKKRDYSRSHPLETSLNFRALDRMDKSSASSTTTRDDKWRDGPTSSEQQSFNFNSPPWTEEESRLIIEAYKKHGSKWRLLSEIVGTRTRNAVRWCCLVFSG